MMKTTLLYILSFFAVNNISYGSGYPDIRELKIYFDEIKSKHPALSDKAIEDYVSEFNEFFRPIIDSHLLLVDLAIKENASNPRKRTKELKLITDYAAEDLSQLTETFYPTFHAEGDFLIHSYLLLQMQNLLQRENVLPQMREDHYKILLVKMIQSPKANAIWQILSKLRAHFPNKNIPSFKFYQHNLMKDKVIKYGDVKKKVDQGSAIVFYLGLGMALFPDQMINPSEAAIISSASALTIYGTLLSKGIIERFSKKLKDKIKEKFLKKGSNEALLEDLSEYSSLEEVINEFGSQIDDSYSAQLEMLKKHKLEHLLEKINPNDLAIALGSYLLYGTAIHLFPELWPLASEAQTIGAGLAIMGLSISIQQTVSLYLKRKSRTLFRSWSAPGKNVSQLLKKCESSFKLNKNQQDPI